jgi:hypothetical protein
MGALAPLKRIITSAREYPELWAPYGCQLVTPEWRAAYEASRETCGVNKYEVAETCGDLLGAGTIRRMGTGDHAVFDAAYALVAWPELAHMLDLPPDELEAIAKLGAPAAVLLLPACRALHHIKELRND